MIESCDMPGGHCHVTLGSGEELGHVASSSPPLICEPSGLGTPGQRRGVNNYPGDLGVVQSCSGQEMY